MVEIARHTHQSIGEITDAWNRALVWDPIDHHTFMRKVFLDPNFRPDGLWLALDGDRVVGLCLALVQRVALEHDATLDPGGYITAFGLAPEYRRTGTGTRLLDAAEEWLAGEGRVRVRIAPYVPHYFVPGVDEERYPGAGEFLTHRGYSRVGEGLGMDCPLNIVNPLEGLGEVLDKLSRDGISVEPLGEGWIPRFFAFLRDEAPADWSRHARQILHDGAPPADIIVAIHGERVVGYCQSEGSHFGPFGVAADYRGRGVGTALLATCLYRMKQRGEHCAWVVWTSERAAPVYERLGFERTRRFTLLSKELPR
ncbi:MAG: GNAT family N-acetyltransferase [Armatimonadia bacterium]|nr:GNAT family N-acetyltransferase [Armatimonadia bacterium]